jgi:hypothetical protein
MRTSVKRGGRFADDRFLGHLFFVGKIFSLSEVIYTRLVLPAASPPGTRDVPGAQWRECNTVQGDDCLCLWPDHRGVKSDACVFRSLLGRWSSMRSERPTPARLESWRMFGSEILSFWSAASACSAIPSPEAVRLQLPDGNNTDPRRPYPLNLNEGSFLQCDRAPVGSLPSPLCGYSCPFTIQ